MMKGAAALMVDRDLAREPCWGDLAERPFVRQLEQFKGAEFERR